ncbi:GMP synthase [glutamine-hydrolyzing] [Methylophaga thiooxydans]|uniref:GMP synthase [glutamine-hydrolyzing] n=1 Tax=Methylophaga thiooxydans TaxID=392484 RepID=A0A0A0BGU7_9GAMM|nr:glutamine-hydrolyzing GMP synthase [Methylophaga thiooxydans]KGM07110.1 GMP synthase [glutamine-hydrolyzing] [Methylophaga thiooxydans]
MSSNIHDHRILILDFGSQYTQLIARRVREAGVYCELHAWDMSDEDIRDFNPNGIILSGGPESTVAEDAPIAPQLVFELGVPVFGICYGMQTMTAQMGGKVENADHHEYGYAQIRARGHTSLLKDIDDHVTEEGHGMLDVWMSHGDRVVELPTGFKLMASTESCPVAGIANEDKRFYGVQFHPEVTHTQQGQRILERFIHDICGCAADWTPGNIADDAITSIREKVGTDEVILGLSGGVDSSVVAALLHKAIGDQLTCVFVDNGLLRYKEGDQVMATFAEHMGVKVIRIDAEQRFLDALAGENDPEKKRKIIGNLFVDIFEEESNKLKAAKWLAQGTIYPDVIESAGSKTGKAHVIKSHHNVGGLPDYMKLELLEPLRELFKDEVRKLGVELGLPYDMVYRHPFPGPGLGVRILGEVKKEYADILRLADHIFIEELRKHDLYNSTSQAFAVFLPIKSVGVTGDGRRYEWVVSLRAVETIDFMTARWAHLPYEFLDHVCRRIVNEVSGISRVVYDITGKPPGTIEWE